MVVTSPVPTVGGGGAAIDAVPAKTGSSVRTRTEVKVGGADLRDEAEAAVDDAAL